MKTKVLLATALVFLMVACKSNEPKEQAKGMAKCSVSSISVKENVSFANYLENVKNNEEAVVYYSFVDYPSGSCSRRTCKRNADPNTIMLSDKIGVHIQDSFRMDDKNGENVCHIRRSAYVVSNEGMGSPRKAMRNDPGTGNEEIVLDFNITTDPVDSIHFIRPYSDDCNPIPLCYYHSMLVEWNADNTNPTKVIVIAEWNGIMKNGTFVDTTVINHTIVDDIGTCVLNDDIFLGMPDEAFVNLWLIRANVVEVLYDGPITLEDAEMLIAGNPESFYTFIHDNPEFLYDLQSTTLAYGAVAHLPIYLIRNTTSPVHPFP